MKARGTTGGDADSLSRLPLPRREEMDAEEQSIFDRLIALNTSAARKSTGPALGLRGPSGITLHSPRLAQAMTQMNEYLRFEAGLPEPLREIAILVVAREADSAYEWAAHEPVARRVGVADEIIASIRDRSSLDDIDAESACLIKLIREAVSARRVDPEIFEAALERFGARRLVDLVALASQYLGTAMMLRTFELRMPEETDSPKAW